MQNLEEAQGVIEQLRDAVEKSEEEVKAIRTKLHGAIRKGKASESARHNLEKEVEELNARLSTVEDAKLADQVLHSSCETDCSLLDILYWLESEYICVSSIIQ